MPQNRDTQDVSGEVKPKKAKAEVETKVEEKPATPELIPVYDQGKKCMVYMAKADVDRLMANPEAIATPAVDAPVISDQATGFIGKPMGPMVRRRVKDAAGKPLSDEEAMKAGYSIIVDRYGPSDMTYEGRVKTRDGRFVVGTVEYPGRFIGKEKNDEDKLPIRGSLLSAIGFPWDAPFDVVFAPEGEWGFADKDGPGYKKITNLKGEVWEVLCMQARLAWNVNARAMQEETEEFQYTKTHVIPEFYKFAVRRIGEKKLAPGEMAKLMEQLQSVQMQIMAHAGKTNAE